MLGHFLHKFNFEFVRTYVLKSWYSLYFDLQILNCSSLSVKSRFFFLSQKIRALPIILSKKETFISLIGHKFFVSNLSDLGTLQWTIMDIYNTFVKSDIFKEQQKLLVIDVGANIGQFARSISLFYPNSKILSFEPDPSIFSILKRNTKNMLDIKTSCIGLGDTNKTLTFYRNNLSVMSSFVPSSKDSGYSDANSINLNITTLDSLLKEEKEIDLLKIDVEGFELEVIKGALSVLSKTKYLLIEVGLGRDSANNNLQILSLIKTTIPSAKIIRFGRTLGSYQPVCQDILISLK